MKLHMVIMWWENEPGSFKPDYDKQHSVTIVGDTPAECMAQYRILSDNHDIVKNTPTHIMEIY